MKHTKEFIIVGIHNNTYLVSPKDGHYIIAEESMANEKLFEAAPKLLEVCLKLRDIIANGKAIIKAEKGQSKYIADWVLENIEAIKKVES